MTITLKEFSQWMLEYINKNFIPLLQPSNPQHQKSIQKWKQLSDIIKDIEKVHLWNLQNCLKSSTSSSVNVDNFELKQLKKHESSRQTATNFNTYDTLLDKKQSLRNTYSYEEQVKFNNNLKNTKKQQSEPRNKSFKYSVSNDDFESKMNFDPKLTRQKSEGLQDDDGFDKLIQSFRKLCCSFENNHKKLLKEDKNLKENMKMEVAHQ